MERSCPQRSNLKADLFLQQSMQRLYSQAQNAFLGAIVGGITIRRAARRIGTSYKPAWDRADAMNNSCTRLLVIRLTEEGTRGDKKLSEFWNQMLSSFDTLQEEHYGLVERLSKLVRHV